MKHFLFRVAFSVTILSCSLGILTFRPGFCQEDKKLAQIYQECVQAIQKAEKFSDIEIYYTQDAVAQSKGNEAAVLMMLKGMNIRDIQPLGESIQGDTATLTMKAQTNMGPADASISFKKENDSWKISEEDWKFQFQAGQNPPPAQ